jgi:hypothetical protein
VDDIVVRLTNLNHPDSSDAAEEIERLRKEVTRLAIQRMILISEDARMYEKTIENVYDILNKLQNAGDELVLQIHKPCRCVEAHDGAINETCDPCAACFDWREVRQRSEKWKI